jgi:hypothetical protein
MSESELNQGEAQARRLESVLAEIEAVVSRPEVAARLRAAPGEEEWNVLEVLGHVNEMIPFWLGHCRTLVQAQGEPPAFGRTIDSPERLEAVARAAHSNLDDLMTALRREVHAGAAMLRGLTDADRAKEGVHNRRGRITVTDAVEALVLAHGEEHVAQIKAALET